MSDGLSRRRFVEALAVSMVSPLASRSAETAAPGTVINDVSRLNPVRVSEEKQPRSTDEVRTALRSWPGPVSVGGGRFSMGGQIAAPHSMHLDMRHMHGVIAFDDEQILDRAVHETFQEIECLAE